MCVIVCLGAHESAPSRALAVGVDCVWFGAQAFWQAKAFNANIGAWNTASVSNMDRLFYETAFNQNIASWNTAKVRFMNQV